MSNTPSAAVSLVCLCLCVSWTRAVEAVDSRLWIRGCGFEAVGGFEDRFSELCDLATAGEGGKMGYSV